MDGFINFIKYISTASVPVVLLVIALYFLFMLLNKQTDHVYGMYFEKFKNSISEEFSKFQKCVDIAFRDEEPRSQVIADTIIKADNIRLDLYKRTYSLFFEILYSQERILKEKPDIQKKSIEELMKKVNQLRIDLFVNSVFLGTLMDSLLPAQIGLWNDIGVIQSKIDGTWKGLKDDFYKSNDEIRNAEKWIMKNSKTYFTLNNIELSEAEIDKLHAERKAMIDDNNIAEND